MSNIHIDKNEENRKIELVKDDVLQKENLFVFYDDAKRILGEEYSKGDYYNQFSGYYKLINSNKDTFGSYDMSDIGLLGDCGNGFLSKNALKELIIELIEYYDNYDEHFQKYRNYAKRRIIEKCKEIQEIKSKESTSEDNKCGYIYVMFHQGYYKIGKSKDCARLGEYTKLAEEPEYIFVKYVNDMNLMEQKLHDRFNDKRTRNGSCEWFSLNNDDLKVIEKMLSMEEVHDFSHTKAYKHYVLRE